MRFRNTVPLPLFSHRIPCLTARLKKELEGYCLEKGIGVLSYGSIGAGVLTGKYKERPVFPKGDTRNESGFYKNCFSEENWPKVSALVDVLREVAEAHNAPVVHAAINWVLANPSMTVALVGAKTPEQVRMNAAAGSWELSAEEKAKIDEAAKAICGKIKRKVLKELLGFKELLKF